MTENPDVKSQDEITRGDVCAECGHRVRRVPPVGEGSLAGGSSAMKGWVCDCGLGGPQVRR